MHRYTHTEIHIYMHTYVVHTHCSHGTSPSPQPPSLPSPPSTSPPQASGRGSRPSAGLLAQNTPGHTYYKEHTCGVAECLPFCPVARRSQSSGRRPARGPKTRGVRVEGADALRQSAPGARTAERRVATGGGERMDTEARRASVPAQPPRAGFTRQAMAAGAGAGGTSDKWTMRSLWRISLIWVQTHGGGR